MPWPPTGQTLLPDDPMTRHTLIVEGPAGSVSTMELFVDDPAEVWRIGHEVFPGRRLAAVNHEKDEEE